MKKLAVVHGHCIENRSNANPLSPSAGAWYLDQLEAAFPERCRAPAEHASPRSRSILDSPHSRNLYTLVKKWLSFH